MATKKITFVSYGTLGTRVQQRVADMPDYFNADLTISQSVIDSGGVALATVSPNGVPSQYIWLSKDDAIEFALRILQLTQKAGHA